MSFCLFLVIRSPKAATKLYVITKNLEHLMNLHPHPPGLQDLNCLYICSIFGNVLPKQAQSYSFYVFIFLIEV